MFLSEAKQTFGKIRSGLVDAPVVEHRWFRRWLVQAVDQVHSEDSEQRSGENIHDEESKLNDYFNEGRIRSSILKSCFSRPEARLVYTSLPDRCLLIAVLDTT